MQRPRFSFDTLMMILTIENRQYCLPGFYPFYSANLSIKRNWVNTSRGPDENCTKPVIHTTLAIISTKTNTTSSHIRAAFTATRAQQLYTVFTLTVLGVSVAQLNWFWELSWNFSRHSSNLRVNLASRDLGLTFVDEILTRDYWDESYWAVLSSLIVPLMLILSNWRDPKKAIIQPIRIDKYRRLVKYSSWSENCISLKTFVLKRGLSICSILTNE